MTRKEISEIKNSLNDRIDPTDDESFLELGLQELRIIYDRLDTAHNQTKLRILTFFGAGLALMSYLYSGQDLFIPAENYGKVFYFMGLGLVISGLSFLLQAMKPIFWSVPIETKITKLFRPKSKVKLLNLLIEEYTESMRFNIGRYEKKILFMNTGFFQLLIGGIILLVIKSIGA